MLPLPEMCHHSDANPRACTTFSIPPGTQGTLWTRHGRERGLFTTQAQEAPTLACECPGAAMTNCHMLGGLTHRNVLSPSSGGRSSRGEIQVLAGPCSLLRHQGRILPASSSFWGLHASFVLGCITPVYAGAMVKSPSPISTEGARNARVTSNPRGWSTC